MEDILFCYFLYSSEHAEEQCRNSEKHNACEEEAKYSHHELFVIFSFHFINLILSVQRLFYSELFDLLVLGRQKLT